MEPLAVAVRGGGEWVLVHRCTGCGVVHLNRSAGDDNVYVLLQLVTRPLAHPTFPLDVLGRL
jgi:hypothetical protein